MNVKQSSLPWYRWLNSNHVIRLLETVQDFIVICLCIGLFSFMVLQLREMVLSLLPPLEFQPVTSDILFLLILVELFRLLIIYLQEHRVSIGVAVEVSIVSVLREVIVRGVLETPWVQVLVACVFLLVLGALLIIRVWLPPTFDGIDPEQFISERHRSRFSDRNQSHQPTAQDLNDHHDVSVLSTTDTELLSNHSAK
ncbi:phosphate-starvation-inducible PsiE family protein [Leptolyngbya sp. FACHB-36]|uniref:phosphate-starvation-inducible PsiE family protein n=1 Tax=Leptolyngbya sp. FACHB-36 TaxID=2692808 RepID=UPI001681041E|nr:phosphate-starvation-inducible PsiE family protein [Leptolyngbya sp. FACHB-36]MBD2019120.1 phosphate-starvation-inducible PsiE family protein [Leptolyngbya sp. FACHB-36]